MENEGSEALCPICGSKVKLGVLTKGYGPIHTISIYCSSGDCNWAEYWKEDEEFGGFLKQ